MGNLAKGSPLIKKLIFFCFLLDTSRGAPRGGSDVKEGDPILCAGIPRRIDSDGSAPG